MRRRATLVAFAVVLIAAFACVNYYLALFEHDRFGIVSRLNLLS